MTTDAPQMISLWTRFQIFLDSLTNVCIPNLSQHTQAGYLNTSNSSSSNFSAAYDLILYCLTYYLRAMPEFKPLILKNPLGPF